MFIGRHQMANKCAVCWLELLQHQLIISEPNAPILGQIWERETPLSSRGLIELHGGLLQMCHH